MAAGAAVALTDRPLDSETAIAAVRAPSRGAVTVFLGTVRNHDRGRPVLELLYDAYRPMAEERLRTIIAELTAEATDLGLAIHHRLGVVPAGEASVVIAAAAPHRDAAYVASRMALERLKTEVPIWKRERYGDGETRWREEEPLL